MPKKEISPRPRSSFLPKVKKVTPDGFGYKLSSAAMAKPPVPDFLVNLVNKFVGKSDCHVFVRRHVMGYSPMETFIFFVSSMIHT